MKMGAVRIVIHCLSIHIWGAFLSFKSRDKMLRDTKSKGACLLACGVERISWLLTLECPSGTLLLSVHLGLVHDGQVILLNEQDDGTR